MQPQNPMFGNAQGLMGTNPQQAAMAAAMNPQLFAQQAAAAAGGQQPTDPAQLAAWQQYYTQYYMWYQQQAAALAQQQQAQAMMADPSGGMVKPNAKGLYTLFVYHLPHSVDNNKLAEIFRPFGEVLEAIVMRENPRDPTSPTRGFGFVSFRTYAEASAAMSGMNGYQIEHKRLQVSFKSNKGPNK